VEDKLDAINVRKANWMRLPRGTSTTISNLQHFTASHSAAEARAVQCERPVETRAENAQLSGMLLVERLQGADV